jgi:hypothetical protein
VNSIVQVLVMVLTVVETSQLQVRVSAVSVCAESLPTGKQTACNNSKPSNASKCPVFMF